jgi:hypothetical protein
LSPMKPGTDMLEVYVAAEQDDPDWIFHIRVL